LDIEECGENVREYWNVLREYVDRILRKIWGILRGCNIVRILDRILKNMERMCENIEKC